MCFYFFIFNYIETTNPMSICKLFVSSLYGINFYIMVFNLTFLFKLIITPQQYVDNMCTNTYTYFAFYSNRLLKSPLRIQFYPKLTVKHFTVIITLIM